jgi:hypothetical protein
MEVAMEYRSEYGEGTSSVGEAGRYGESGRSSPQGRLEGENRRVSEKLRGAKERLSDVYGRTSETADRLYHEVVDFGRSNPGTMALVALGAGISVGLWLASSDRSSPYRRRIVPSLATHAAEAILDIFDGRRR